VELAEAAEDGGVRSEAVPALTDQRRTDEAGGEAEADNDLDEQVVVIEDLGFRVGCRCCRTRQHVVIQVDPGKAPA
jgi:hypothetical protein